MFDCFSYQKKIVEQLCSDVSENTVLHAYLFEGIEGSGKKTIAHEFAKSLMCGDKNMTANTPCDRCNSCAMCNVGTHPDVIAFSVKEKSSISVDDVRGLISDVYIKPFYSKRKVYIIEDSNLLTPQAQNALLKILEEPPRYVTFILISHNSSLILDTVLSRVRRIEVSGATNEEIKSFLKNQYPNADADFATAACGGSIGKAISLACDYALSDVRKEASGVAEKLISSNQLEMFDAVKFMEKEKANMGFVLDFWIGLFYDAMLIQVGRREFVLNTDFIKIIEKIGTNLSAKSIVWTIDKLCSTQAMLFRHLDIKAAAYNMTINIREGIHD